MSPGRRRAAARPAPNEPSALMVPPPAKDSAPRTSSSIASGALESDRARAGGGADARGPGELKAVPALAAVPARALARAVVELGFQLDREHELADAMHEHLAIVLLGLLAGLAYIRRLDLDALAVLLEYAER